MSVALYNLGTLTLLAGVTYVCHLARIPERWMVCIALLLLSAGAVNAMSNLRQRDLS